MAKLLSHIRIGLSTLYGRIKSLIHKPKSHDRKRLDRSLWRVGVIFCAVFKAVLEGKCNRIYENHRRREDGSVTFYWRVEEASGRTRHQFPSSMGHRERMAMLSINMCRCCIVIMDPSLRVLTEAIPITVTEVYLYTVPKVRYKGWVAYASGEIVEQDTTCIYTIFKITPDYVKPMNSPEDEEGLVLDGSHWNMLTRQESRIGLNTGWRIR
ncbi:hypothetical protein CC78DRAFT_582846 [Lojkania enalia]|uniref:Uncharacterized protein n=1 Tax=Lojkania enalia TaxID=147567 RepID=A0A9P4N1D3_9PLEO|nr:hypothetical protein CC78DRAFT_582846 [Didymosphaeria enalia]